MLCLCLLDTVFTHSISFYFLLQTEMQNQLRSNSLSFLWKRPRGREEFKQRPTPHKKKWRLVLRSHGVLLLTLYMLPFLLLKPSNKTRTGRFYTWKLQNTMIRGLYVKATHIDHVILWFQAQLCAYFSSPVSDTHSAAPACTEQR